MTRIIAGKWGGRRLHTPTGRDTRPTADRVREAMFSSLSSHCGDFAGLRVLDLFAGSGALGFEALSRGAGHVDFVDSDAKAVRALLANMRELGVRDRIVIHRETAQRFTEKLAPGMTWDLVFLDPPYDLLAEDVAHLVDLIEPFVSAEGLFVVERSSRTDFAWPPSVEPHRDKRYGETHLWYGR